MLEMSTCEANNLNLFHSIKLSMAIGGVIRSMVIV